MYTCIHEPFAVTRESNTTPALEHVVTANSKLKAKIIGEGGGGAELCIIIIHH